MVICATQSRRQGAVIATSWSFGARWFYPLLWVIAAVVKGNDEGASYSSETAGFGSFHAHTGSGYRITARNVAQDWQDTRRTQQVDAQNLGMTKTKEVPKYSFVNKGEDSEVSEEVLISSNITIYGKFLQDNLFDMYSVVLGTLTKICGCREEDPLCKPERQPRIYSTFTQDIATFNKPIIGIFISYYILTVKFGEPPCADALAVAGFGADEPPFDRMPAPALRALLQMEMAANILFASTKLDTWKIHMDLPACGTFEVLRTLKRVELGPDEYDENQKCADFSDSANGAGALLASAGSVKWASPGAMCEFMTSACMCAALKTCSWENVTGTNGRLKTCAPSDVPVVDCSYCPLQESCPSAPSLQCSSLKRPCSCARVPGGGCYWITASRTCEEVKNSKTQKTSCFDCPTLWGCAPPKVTSFWPKRGVATLPIPNGNSIINITFDKLMAFTFTGSTPVLGNLAVAFVCRMPPPSLPRMHDVSLAHLGFCNTSGHNASWGIDDPNAIGNVLQVDTLGVENEYTTDCDLVIQDGKLQDLSGMSFLGVGVGAYSFSMSDTMPPKLLQFFPKTAAIGVSITPTLSFTFCEEVRIGPTPFVRIMQFGNSADASTMTNLTSSADSIFAEIDISNIGVIANGQLSMTLTTPLATETMYSISLSDGSVIDKSMNLFLGLDDGNMMFRTETRVLVQQDQKASALDFDVDPYIIVGVAVGMALCWCNMTLACFVIYRLYSKHKANVRVSQEPTPLSPRSTRSQQSVKLVPMDEITTRDSAWDGSFLKSHTLIEAGNLEILKAETDRVPNPRLTQKRVVPIQLVTDSRSPVPSSERGSRTAASPAFSPETSVFTNSGGNLSLTNTTSHSSQMAKRSVKS